jgi:sulfofructose kinase
LIPNAIALPTPFPFDGALVDTRWPDGAAQIVKAARRAGKPAVIDAEAPVALAADALAHSSHIAFSEQGLTDYAGRCDGAALKEVATQLGVWCAVTRGALPVLCHDGQTLTEVPTFPAPAANTLGAGDVWHGAFTLGLAQGRSALDAVGWANAAASLKLRHSIAVETLPNAEEVMALLCQEDHT